MISLGPFSLDRVIGRGAVGVVWRGVRAGDGVPVAVKVLTDDHARHPEAAAAFRNEVWAMAGLDHPGIISIFDHGVVPASGVATELTAEAEAEAGAGAGSAAGPHASADPGAASGGEASLGRELIRPGCPYLVMELATGGSLAEVVGGTLPPWEEVLPTLLGVIDALAHAHARGLVHRDLKPANVVLCGPDDGRPGPKLTDFGIAHATFRHERTGTAFSVKGTPDYMAPEQIQARWRDFGPWTDLYALGCMAFELTSGTVPVAGDDLRAVIHAHITGERRRFLPRSPVPEGFEGWLDSLLATDHRKRPQRAADAAATLRLLGPAAAASSVAQLPVVPVDHWTTPTLDVPADVAAGAPPSSASAGVDDAAGEDGGGTTAPDLPVVSGAITFPELAAAGLLHECPPSWRPEEATPARQRSAGGGLALFGLREIPLVDRDAERDALWDALRRTADEGRAHFVLLEGAVGLGTSRLAEWLCQRANELGLCEVLKVLHSPTAGPRDGLSAAVAWAQSCQSLPWPRVLERVEAHCRAHGQTDPDEWYAMAELIQPRLEAPTPTHPAAGGASADREDSPSPDGEDPPTRPSGDMTAIRLSTPDERHAVVRRYLERLARRRVVVVWLDDVQWGLDALALASHVMRAQASSPSRILMVGTAQIGELEGRRREAVRLADLLETEGACRIRVGPLPQADRRVLVREHLGLSADLATQVEERAGGNPLFSVQVVEGWVQRGLLESGPEGLQLRPGAPADLPGTLGDLWVQHVDAILESRPPDHVRALELAAVLGQAVDGAQWREICGLAKLQFPEDLVAELVRRRLARPAQDGEESGWSFVHGMLRESLLGRVRDGGRWVEHNRLCAEMLRARTGQAASESFAAHLLAAGDTEKALAPLLDAADCRRLAGDVLIAETLLEHRERAMEALDLDEGDRRRVDGWILLSKVLGRQGRVDEAVESAARAEEVAGRKGWTELEARALAERGRAAHHQGDLAGAWRHLGRAAELAREGDEALLAACLCNMAHVLMDRGALDRASELYEESLELCVSREDLAAEAECHRGLAQVAKQRGDLVAAGAALARARHRFERSGARVGVSACLTLEGDLRRHSGDLTAAGVSYQAALHRVHATGAEAATVVRAKQALLDLERGSPAKAREALEECLTMAEARSWQVMSSTWNAFLAACAVALDDGEAFDRYAAIATEHLGETGFRHVDVARMATRAGDRLAAGAAEAGRSPESSAVAVSRATVAYRLAFSQWRDLGREAEAQGIAWSLASLDAG